MLRGGDVLVLYGLIASDGSPTLRALGSQLGVQHSKVQRALDRLSEAGIYDAQRRRVVPHAAEEFLIHALKYLHPIREGALARGVPTAWGAAPLRDEIRSGDAPPVWPSPHGKVRGPSVSPIDPKVVELVGDWPEVAELAALCDALIIGDARVRKVAEKHIRASLRSADERRAA